MAIVAFLPEQILEESTVCYLKHFWDKTDSYILYYNKFLEIKYVEKYRNDLSWLHNLSFLE